MRKILPPFYFHIHFSSVSLLLPYVFLSEYVSIYLVRQCVCVCVCGLAIKLDRSVGTKNCSLAKLVSSHLLLLFHPSDDDAYYRMRELTVVVAAVRNLVVRTEFQRKILPLIHF